MCRKFIDATCKFKSNQTNHQHNYLMRFTPGDIAVYEERRSDDRLDTHKRYKVKEFSTNFLFSDELRGYRCQFHIPILSQND